MSGVAWSSAGLGWAACVAATHLYAAARTAARREPARDPSDDHATDVTLVRPCAGAERGLREALRSTGAMAGAAGIEVVFAVGSERDPAYAVASDVARELRSRGVDAATRVTTTSGPNHKASQLEVVCRGLHRPFVVVADSDVDLTGVHLGSLVAPLRRDPSASALWAPPVEAPVASTLGDRLSATILGASLHAFPVLAGLDGGGMVGKLFAIRASSLAASGGFGALRDVLGEDVELARRLRERGGRITAATTVVRARPSGRSVGDVVRRFARWVMVVRSQRAPLLLSYPLLFCATPMIAAACVAEGGGLGWTTLAVLVLSRWVVACVAARVGRLRRPSLLLLLASDIVLFAAFLVAIGTRRVRWRDRELRLVAAGRLVDVTSSAAGTGVVVRSS